MKLSLLVMTAGKQEGKVLAITLPQFLIGRDPQCQLLAASPLISKRHCAIIQREGKAFIRDFGSTNGTFVNEEPVQGERELQHDDELKVGPITFTVQLEKTVAPSTKTPAPPTKPVTSLKTPAPGATPAAAAEKPGVGKTDTPIPATATAASRKSGEEDDIAAMLLGLDDGEGSGEGAIVPEGSTVFDLKVPPELADANKAGDQSGTPGKPGQAPAKPAPSGDTRSAAAKLLEKMTKRPRS